MTEDKSQVRLKFFTREQDESLHVQDTPIYAPISLKRYGLSEIVNHLLELETAVPFDFLIDGELLRTSLQDYLTRKGLSSESSLNVEYTRAVLPPSYLASFNNEDWISSIDVGDKHIINGSYDGIVRTWNLSGKVDKQYSGHSGPMMRKILRKVRLWLFLKVTRHQWYPLMSRITREFCLVHMITLLVSGLRFTKK